MAFDEKSAGSVVFCEEDGERKYLLLYYGKGHWGFPRGNLEGDETEKEAAIREIKEETGIEDLEFISGFRETNEWYYKNKGETIHKTASFFLAKTNTRDVKLSSEHSSYKWLNYDDAMERLTFKNTRKVLGEVKEYLNQRLDRWFK